MPKLHVNIDHVATLRQARRALEPDPVAAASICELGGADGITVHLREDRRHIQDQDVRQLRRVVKKTLNLESSLAPEIVAFARDVLPDEVCLVPENRLEITTEGGLDAVREFARLKTVVGQLKEKKIVVSIFVDPDEAQLRASRDAGADFVELHTGAYASAFEVEGSGGGVTHRELNRLTAAAALGRSIGLRVNAGHGLNYKNVKPVAAIAQVEELNIGFSIIAKSVFTGLERAVREMKELVSNPKS